MFFAKTFLLVFLLSNTCLGKSNFVRYEWNYFNFTWPSVKAYNDAINRSYIPKNNILSGIKIWKDRMYLTLPRWYKGVPAPLVSVPVKSINNNKAPLLEPFPNWRMQKLDDCSAFQFVQSMEIDPLGRMWIIESGRTEFMSPKPKNKCPAKLIIIDLENNNKILLNYLFPKTVVRKNSVILNDIVLDHEDGGFAYITDTDVTNPGIIVFSLKKKSSWKVTHPTMKPDEEASNFFVNGTYFKNSEVGVDGIALSPASTEGNRVIYYLPLTSYNLYSLPVNELKKNALKNVKLIGKKSSQTDGMMISSIGDLYYALLNQDAVAVWNTYNPIFKENIYFQDRVTNQWPDGFGIDEGGNLYWTSNRWQRSRTNSLNLQVPNYRIIVTKIYNKSYQYYEDGSSPEIPLVA